MDRSKEIEEYIKDFRDNRKQHKRIYLNKNQKKLMEAFRRRLKDLLSRQIKEQEIQETGKIKYIYLMPLLSSGYTESYQMALGISNDKLYLDESKKQVFWYPEPLHQDIEKALEESKAILRKKFLRLEEYELLGVKRILLQDDRDVFEDSYTCMAQGCMDLLAWSAVYLEDEILFLYGNYMDKLKIVWHSGGKDNG
ncbi:hypothetical protein [Otoolea muris]|uniref:hypothetical protein n=1 Tax=Otoolea muris TaxID=2941515 RepID=UPI00203ADD13|nr:hypothetical protein [Otoolea muris]